MIQKKFTQENKYTLLAFGGKLDLFIFEKKREKNKISFWRWEVPRTIGCDTSDNKMLTVSQYNELSKNQKVYSLNSMFSQQKWAYYNKKYLSDTLSILYEVMNMNDKNDAMRDFTASAYANEPKEALSYGDVWRATHRYLRLLRNYFRLNIEVSINDEIAYRKTEISYNDPIRTVRLKYKDDELKTMNDETIHAPNEAMNILFSGANVESTVLPLTVPWIPKFLDT